MERLSTTESTLLKLLSRSLFQNEVTFEEGIDWNAVLQEAIQQAVPAVAFADFQESSDETLMNRINNVVYSTISNNTEVHHNHLELHKLLSNHNIPYVILKGCVSASYYPEPAYRSMGDVDFLVFPENFQKCCELLEENGFLGNDEPFLCEKQYQKENAVYEIHNSVNGIPQNETGKHIEKILSDIISDAKNIEGYMAPTAFHHCFVMLLHVSIHMLNDGIGLRHLCDWAVFVNRYSSYEFVSTFKAPLQQIGLWRFAQILTQLSSEYIGLPVQVWASENVDIDYLTKLMEDILHGGNFGRKDEDRYEAGKFISNRSKGNTDNSSTVIQLFSSVIDNIQIVWPITKKYRILFPFAFIAYGFRFLYRLITGKRRKFNICSPATKLRKI